MTGKIPTLRLDQVEKRLRRFSITARDGKGSELVFEGKRLVTNTFVRYRVGRHKSNREIHSSLLKAILRRFEITLEEFLNDTLH